MMNLRTKCIGTAKIACNNFILLLVHTHLVYMPKKASVNIYKCHPGFFLSTMFSETNLACFTSNDSLSAVLLGPR